MIADALLGGPIARRGHRAESRLHLQPGNVPRVGRGAADQTKLILPPGPNNPVGVAWISLDLPGYGIHGTPSPEHVGRTESHGCFRLANWNAEYLLRLVNVGTPVYVEK